MDNVLPEKTSGQESSGEPHLQDHLLECLVIISQIKQSPYSRASITAGLPLVDNRLTPELFIRAAERMGINAELHKRPINKISSLVLPVVLLLENDQACVLTKIFKDGSAEVVYPYHAKGTYHIDKQELEQRYSGYVFFIQMQHEFESRTQDEVVGERQKSWFWGTLWKFKRQYAQVLMASVFINLFALAIPLFVMNVYDRVVPNNAIETLWVLAIGIIIVFVFDFLLRSLRGYFIDATSKKVDVILASKLFAQALGIQLKAKPASTGVQANQLRDFENVRDFFTSATIAGLVDLPFIFLFLWVIWFVGGVIAIIPTMAIPIVVISAILISIPLNRAVEKSFFGGAQKNAILVESLNNLETIKSVSAEGNMQGRWERYIAITSEAGLKSRFYSQLAVNITTLVHYGVTVGVVVTGVYMIESRDLTVGALIACTILSGKALAPLSQITSLLTRYQLTRYSLRALDNVMDMPLERPPEHKFLHRPRLQGGIEFEGIHYKYQDQPIDLFKDVSFKIEPGEKVGILGSMGSGKTTLLKLIMNFYQPDKGAIRVDGIDLAQIDPADLRRSIGYVEQDPHLFFGTVRDNIAMKAPWADDAMILECARVSGSDEFIKRHPAGYDLKIGENGQGLSGGQCQTIAIARALIMSPSILLMDEPTSSMDNSTEHMFIQNMKNYLGNKSLLLITHKLSLLQLVDRLLVLQGGKIIADGEKERVLTALKRLKRD